MRTIILILGKFKRKLIISFSHFKIRLLIKSKRYKNVFVIYPFFVWNETLFQRPEQIQLSLSKIDKNLIFFCSNSPTIDKCIGIRMITRNLYLTTEYTYIMNFKTNKRILYEFSTNAKSRLIDIKNVLKNNDRIIYDYIDDFNSKFVDDFSKDYINKHNFLIKNENVFLSCTASSLLKDAKKYRKKNYKLICNGVNVDDFNKEYVVPNDLKIIKNKYDKIILYYGALASWFDYDLLNKCAKEYSQYAFVLIGRELDDSLKKSNLLNNKNICFLGGKQHLDLVNYAKSSDLLIIPFVINDITLSTSPVKLFEYMACQRPILTTNMPECKLYKSAVVAKNQKEFIELIPKVIEKINDKSYLKTELREAKANSWDSKAKDIMDLIGS